MASELGLEMFSRERGSQRAFALGTGYSGSKSVGVAKCRVGRGPTSCRSTFKRADLRDVNVAASSSVVTGLVSGAAQRIQGLPRLLNCRLSLCPLPFYLQLGEHPRGWGVRGAEEGTSESPAEPQVPASSFSQQVAGT